MHNEFFSVPQVAMVMPDDVRSAVIQDDGSSRRRRKDRPHELVEHDVPRPVHCTVAGLALQVQCI